MQFQVIHESPSLLVINKPAGISLLRDRSGAADLWSMLTSDRKLYPAHRLDKGTSGVLLIGKTQAAQSELARAFNGHAVRKFYIAQVVGAFPGGSTLTIDLPLRKGRKSRYRVAGMRDAIERHRDGWRINDDGSGLAASTRVRLLSSEGSNSWVVAQPLSGRTHQLRVHLSWTGFPILGDHLYGKPADAAQQADRLMLHCHRLVLPDGSSYSATFP